MRWNIGYLLSFLLILLANSGLQAQQDAMYTHYMYNTLAVNPAYAGSRDALTATLLHRSQWVSFPGAPVTQTLTLHSPVFNANFASGLSVVNDKVGPLSNTSVYVDAAYIMFLNGEDRLAFGIKAGVDFFRGAFSDIQTGVDGDNVFGFDVGGDVKPNFGLGVYYYTPTLYLGASMPALLAHNYEVDEGEQTTVAYTRARHLYLIGGTVIEIHRDLKLKPTTFLKMTPGAPIEVDLTTTAIYRERFHGGLMYRTDDAAGVLLGFDISEQLFAGYSFDWSFRNLTTRYNAGSHEVALRYDFIYKNRRRIKSPRYF
jgi:type IX secretion system PorP/SprF family membrane protein